MATNKLQNSNLAERVLKLSSLYSTDKEFLNTCGIANPTIITNIRKGTTKTLSADYLAKIVRGTGCNGNWLLTGEGEMFEIRENPMPESMAADEEISYQYQRALQLIEKIEQAPAEIKALPLPPDIEVRLTRLLLKLLERRLDEPPNE